MYNRLHIAAECQIYSNTPVYCETPCVGEAQLDSVCRVVLNSITVTEMLGKMLMTPYCIAQYTVNILSTLRNL